MRKFFHIGRLLLAGAMLLPAGVARAQDYIFVDGKINNAPVRLIFSTAQSTFLFRNTVARIGLLTTKLPDSVPVPTGGERPDLTENYAFISSLLNLEHPLYVINNTPALPADVDGMLGWSDTVAPGNEVFLVNAEKRSVAAIALPADLSKWTKWKMGQEGRVLSFECPDGAKTMRITIDTGSRLGVMYNSDQWKRWREARQDPRGILYAMILPGQKNEYREILRARKIICGNFVLEDVPVSERNEKDSYNSGNSDVTLGLAALSRMQLIIDRKHGLVYTLPSGNTDAQFDYNRVGALFVPDDTEKEEAPMVAHVVKGSAAEEAGIKDGDVLLKVEEMEIAKWRTLNDKLRGYFGRKAGTPLKLLIQRDGVTREVTVTLKDLPLVD